MPLDILLVDDHRLLRDGIRSILDRAPEFRIVGEAENGADAVRICRTNRPDMVLMDISMPGMNGIEATTEILRYCPETRVVMLSMYDDENSVVCAIRSGARAFVLKRGSAADLLEALRTVARGGSYLSSAVSDRLLNRLQRGDPEVKPSYAALKTLSPRESQVLRMLAEGKTSKEMALLLNLGLQTVRSYRKTMMKKLGINSVAVLTHLAVAAGLTQYNRAIPLPELAAENLADITNA
jgi:DNA-binding NarL/FixJ family response regulator